MYTKINQNYQISIGWFINFSVPNVSTPNCVTEGVIMCIINMDAPQFALSYPFRSLCTLQQAYEGSIASKKNGSTIQGSMHFQYSIFYSYFLQISLTQQLAVKCFYKQYTKYDNMILGFKFIENALKKVACISFCIS